MKIHGFQTLTLLDYPGHLGATLFFGGCNFRCPFCQNEGLVLSCSAEPIIPEEEILTLLKKRKGILEGVCITGGEPTLQDDLPLFIEKIKALGYLVKLDTNGSRPDMIESLHRANLIDYVAMDIKSSQKNYGKVCGRNLYDLTPILSSAEYLMNCGIDYEFRTTVVKELHMTEDFEAIGTWLAGSERYFLQAYRDSEHVIQKGLHSYGIQKMKIFQEILKKSIPLVELRGIDS